jgi:hypothetical protein
MSNMLKYRNPWLMPAILLVTNCVVQSATAGAPPADVCSLLSAAELSTTLGQAYDSPQKSVAPRPFPNTAEGTDCSYRSKSGTQSTVLFRAYFDPSPSAAADLFTRLSKFYGTPTPVPGLGDVAYVDESHGLHVLKANVRFYIKLDPAVSFTPTLEKQLRELGGRVSARL